HLERRPRVDDPRVVGVAARADEPSVAEGRPQALAPGVDQPAERLERRHQVGVDLPPARDLTGQQVLEPPVDARGQEAEARGSGGGRGGARARGRGAGGGGGRAGRGRPRGAGRGAGGGPRGAGGGRGPGRGAGAPGGGGAPPAAGGRGGHERLGGLVGAEGGGD